jgi:hypothetical protein
MQVIKSVVGDNVKRYQISTDASFGDLYQTIKTSHKLTQPFTVKYFDDEGDEITIENDNELKEAVRTSSSILKLNVFLDKVVKVDKTQENKNSSVETPFVKDDIVKVTNLPVNSDVQVIQGKNIEIPYVKTQENKNSSVETPFIKDDIVKVTNLPVNSDVQVIQGKNIEIPYVKDKDDIVKTVTIPAKPEVQIKPKAQGKNLEMPYVTIFTKDGVAKTGDVKTTSVPLKPEVQVKTKAQGKHTEMPQTKDILTKDGAKNATVPTKVQKVPGKNTEMPYVKNILTKDCDAKTAAVPATPEVQVKTKAQGKKPVKTRAKQRPCEPNNLEPVVLTILPTVSRAVPTKAKNHSQSRSEVTKTSQSNSVHVNVTCDGCGIFPIIGERFKCVTCEDFDLCLTCEQKRIHPANHHFVKFKVPVHACVEREAVHKGIICDGCGNRDFSGDRYKCTLCPDFDLCSKCESQNLHPDHHAMIKIRVPVVQGAVHSVDQFRTHKNVQCAQPRVSHCPINQVGYCISQKTRSPCSSDRRQCPMGQARKASPFQTGAYVQLHGLKNQSFNGKTGIVGEYDVSKGRYSVTIDQLNKTVSLRPENLKLLDQKELVSAITNHIFSLLPEQNRKRHQDQKVEQTEVPTITVPVVQQKEVPKVPYLQSQAEFLRHVNFEEGAKFLPGQTFTKSWLVKNCGETSWPVGSKLIFIRGDRELVLSEEYPQNISLSPDSNSVVSARLLAPYCPGSYTAYFQLASADGVVYGPSLCCFIEVEDNKTAHETAQKTAQEIESKTTNDTHIQDERILDLVDFLRFNEKDGKSKQTEPKVEPKKSQKEPEKKRY